MTRLRYLAGSLALLILSACTSLPSGLSVVENFDLQRYLGTWYEIARLDHSFERGLNNISAQYSLRDDGGVRVVNRGFNAEAEEWVSAEGKAYFIDDTDKGRLKVSFFGPFYGAYNIIALGDDYEYAMISGPDRDYLWILARSPALSPELMDKLVRQATDQGFATDELIWVEHDRQDPELP